MVSSKRQLQIKLFHGPDRVPFELSQDQGQGVSCDIYQPFHGIISRGLLSKIKQQENILVNLWNRKAHLLDSELNGHDEPDGDLKRLADWARECKVHSFAQSAQVVHRYLEKLHSECFQNSEEVEYDVWNIKEGHTSSVWKVTYEINGIKSSFALNVARDYEAGLELLKTSKKMKAIEQEYPDINMAIVRDIQDIPMVYFGETINVVVVQNDWIENATEIHLLENKELGPKRYVLVDRFLTDSSNPARIGKIRGRYCNQSEAVKIENDIEIFLNKAATLKQPIDININDGDVVWDDKKAVIVAIS